MISPVMADQRIWINDVSLIMKIFNNVIFPSNKTAPLFLLTKLVMFDLLGTI